MQPHNRLAGLKRYARFSIAIVLAPPGVLMSHSVTHLGVRHTSSLDSAMITAASQAQWIVNAQLPDGAIATCPKCPSVWPYLANIAAIGLSRASEVTGDGSYATAAWNYLRWYASVEDRTTGYVTDYNVVAGNQLVSSGRFDSTDAYAGTFLTAAWDAYMATQSQADLESVAGGITRAMRAIASTQQPDGLTWAEPSWHVAYLMDVSQALAGLQAAARMQALLGHPRLAAVASRRYEAMRAGIARLWDPPTGAFDWAKQQQGGWQHPTDWNVLYPDGFEQVYAVAWGAVSLTHAKTVMSTFARLQPKWSNPDAYAEFSNGSQQIWYWPETAIALNAVSSGGTASTGLLRMLAGAEQAKFGWPYTTALAGEVIVALSGTPIVENPPARQLAPPRPGPPLVSRL